MPDIFSKPNTKEYNENYDGIFRPNWGKPLLIVSKERVVSPDGETKHREQERGTNGR